MNISLAEKNLDRAHQQAIDYFPGLKDVELPRYIIVCDFANFRMYDLEKDGNIVSEFSIEEFPNNIEHFGFIAGYQKTVVMPEDPVNIKAAEKMAKLHDKLREAGYEGHDLRVMLVRLLFCLFAEDTGIFERNLFRDLILNHTNEDGSDLGMVIAQLFQILNSPEDERQKTLPKHFVDFAYVNGKLFEERLQMASFDSEMRESLLNATMLNWSYISPAIFGSLFQGVMDDDVRRNLGAHYTSESNILKLVKPLFLDDLWEEFKKCKTNKKALSRFHDKLASLKFLDPACGCGNFLVITYRELRLLELEVLLKLYPADGLGRRQGILSISHIIRVNVDQFFGIEIEEFPAQIAQVALWLTDHQMNIRVSEAFGLYFVRLPLIIAPHIHNCNALTTPWNKIIDPLELDYILGNPPFAGKQFQNDIQKEDMRAVFSGYTGTGVLDYVTAWYKLATEFIRGTKIRVGYVSTNSISQGEQVSILWNILYKQYNIKIHFAHRTFRWSNEARGKAAVHCVIIGFGLEDIKPKILFDYETLSSDPQDLKTTNINPYLVPGNDLIIVKRQTPLCNVPTMSFGSMANDGGHLIMSDEEKTQLLLAEPEVRPYIFRYMGSREFINNIPRWCLWLKNANPNQIRKLKYVHDRVENVKKVRLASRRKATQELAEYPMLFGEIRQPVGSYLAVPKTSSERRTYIPTAFLTPYIIANTELFTLPESTLYHFGIISSAMHMSWMRYTAGRLKSDYRYSIGIVYNNFPWPQELTNKQIVEIENFAQGVLDARSQFPESTLSDLYDPISMPPILRRAHQNLDRAVDKCYRSQPFTTELNRVSYLFDLYENLI